ncbi:putative oxidoreductase C24B10.20 [Psilocybe cubensis]|uniref:NAD(P)-binding protein n=2 Tax=Psilocybe cubensis TaxID=181762 RepID=A0A8H8CPV6_PSICU|nr:putative oxidoreductase C24B10.20 [Psilocybe cubensis]KAH9485089.1 putative oxidoreductase C24B10.20 [Psilocybe cubensis]
MASGDSVIYIIAGANRPRGIGYGMTSYILASNKEAFVYAGARDPDQAIALQELKSKYPNRLAIIKCVAGDVAGNHEAMKEIDKRHGRVDTVIACMGVANAFGKVNEVTLSDMENHFLVNAMGPIALFQAAYSLLRKSLNPRFVSLGSSGGCISGGFIESPVGSVCYGTSKAALHWATRKIHFENEWLVAFPLSPGAVGTDMVDNIVEADKTGNFQRMIESMPQLSAGNVVESLVKIIDGSTRERNGGEFMHVDGTKLPYW